MPLLETKGAASAQGFGLTLNTSAVNYIEDVFSTYLYAGTGANQTITNNIDLSTKGGLVWRKQRTAVSWTAYTSHSLSDTVRGVNAAIMSDRTDAQVTGGDSFVTAFNTSGFSMGSDTSGFGTNKAGENYVSWTFREQPKFFDVVTYTGTGSATTFAHNLGAVPGCIIVKCTSSGGTNWRVYHRSLTSAAYSIQLNQTNVETSQPSSWNSTAPTSTVFSVGADVSVNGLGDTYVAYLFAHDAGGFGLTGTDNVISCGTFTSDGSANFSVTLGYEPQFVMYKSTSATGPWYMLDTMRGYNLSSAGDNYLAANSSSAEAVAELGSPTATGFVGPAGAVSTTYIYVAVRRGPMKVPTNGTSVFEPVARTGTGATATVSSPNFPVDLAIIRNQPDIQNNKFADRLRGKTLAVVSDSTAAEGTDVQGVLGFDLQNGISVGSDTAYNKNATAMINWLFRRAPKFFDEVCYTGTGSGTQTISHNLGVTPELTINKSRSGVRGWTVYYNNTTFLRLNQTNAGAAETLLNPTSTTFDAALAAGFGMNAAETYVTYLFATCPGVSKVGSYTGTGTTLQINCGFTAGSRFVLIKRTDSTGDWYVWDSARGIVAGNDPYLLLNSTAAEVTGTDYVDTYSAGFEISSTAPAAINASGGTFIFLAIA